MAEIYKGKAYSLTDAQIKALANICYREQGGGEAGVRACASHMLNYYEKYQTKRYSNPYDCTIKSGWYGTESFNKQYISGNYAPQSVINYVTDVIRNGNRSLPSYVDEYDCLSDVKTASNNGVSFKPTDRSKYKKDVTKVTNVYGSTWTFFCFPDGASGVTDAFGYISKPANSTEKPVSTTSTTNIPNAACSWAENIAANQSHGYSQANRWGPDYDCSSLVISAYIAAGVPIDKNQVYYTGNMQGLKNYGFNDVTSKVNLDTGSGLLRGDVLYYHISGTNGHTAMYCGNGKIVHARGQSYGSSASGDQGTEIAVTSYSRSKWQYVLRYGNGGTTGATSSNTVASTSSSTQYEYGDIGNGVKEVQKLLNKLGYGLEEDGEFGANTYTAVVHFQSTHNLGTDGIVGKKTMAKLKEVTASKTAANNSSKTSTTNNSNKVSQSTTNSSVKTSAQTKTGAVVNSKNRQRSDGSYTVNKSVDYIGAATDNNINVRSGPGYQYDNIRSWPRLEKGYEVEVCDSVTALDESQWLYVCINHNIYGFVAAQYIAQVRG